MASQLYKVLNNIEDGRQKIVKELQNKGQDAKDNDTLRTLASYIQNINADNWGKAMPLWTRPLDWPDSKSILKNGEERDGYKPQAIMLLNNLQDTTVLRGKNSSSTGSTDSIGASAYLMSDGTYYDSTGGTISHTWDKSKDIDGKYRYILCYFSSTAYASYIPRECNIIEIIFGTFPHTYIRMTESNNSKYYKYLENIEILDDSNITKIIAGNGANMLSGLSDLKRIALGPVQQLQGKSGYNFLSSNPQLQIFDAPNLIESLFRTGLAQGVIKIINTPKITISSYTNNGGLVYLEELNCISLNLENLTGYMPNKFSNISFISSYDTPCNAETLRYNSTAGTLNGVFFRGIPALVTLDLSAASHISTGSGSETILGTGCPNLKNIIWPQRVEGYIDIKHLELDKDSILDLFNKMAICTSTPSYYIYLSEKNKEELSANELAIAIDKGWEVK